MLPSNPGDRVPQFRRVGKHMPTRMAAQPERQLDLSSGPDGREEVRQHGGFAPVVDLNAYVLDLHLVDTTVGGPHNKVIRLGEAQSPLLACEPHEIGRAHV